MHSLRRFNIRVYGLLINEHQQLLVSDEVFKNGTLATKFPGGGLELGEGISDCLIREFMEETGIRIALKAHYYTTDFFVQSFFDSESQVISIYYLVESDEWRKIHTANKPFELEIIPGHEAESFRWVKLHDLPSEKYITLPIDKIVLAKLMNEFSVG